MKRKWPLLAIPLLALLTIAIVRDQHVPVPDTGVAAKSPAREEVVTGPGRVEPASEEIRVSAEIGGRLRQVLVDEGARVRRGDLVAALENDDYRAAVDVAQAAISTRQAELDRVLSGARAEERREAAAAVTEAEATVKNAEAELRRYRALFADHLTAREQVETRETAAAEATSRLEAARQHRDLVEATARTEDRDRAQAQVVAARAALAEARARLDKTEIHAPLDGVILRRNFRSGETVTPGAAIVTMGDISRLRVRMEVDERDVARIHVAQEAWCTADAYGSRRFPGRIVRIGKILGRKTITTGDPAERADTKVLEALVELEPGAALPAGLRVDVFVPAR
jgi:HlyD family secretion protein